MKSKKSNINPAINSIQAPPLKVRGGEGGVIENEQVLKLQQEMQDLDSNWKRALADYQNLVRRVESDKKDFVKYATANLISKFLPSLDILELAATHSKDTGVQMAVKQFQDVLQSEGLEIIAPAVGDSYNHLVHECIENLPSEALAQEGTIAETLSKGYKINDFIIRPARVKVYKYGIN